MTIPSWTTPKGNIGDAYEGEVFSFTFDYDAIVPFNITKIAGDYPPGISMTTIGTISGTVEVTDLQESYDFVLRISNDEGFQDRTFTINIAVHDPIWADPNDLGSFPPSSEFDYSFFVINVNDSNQQFKKVTGSLPPGLALNETGRLYGIISSNSIETTYTFTIEALIDSTDTLEKTFTITVDSNSSSPPVWLTPQGSIGEIITGIAFSTQVLAISPNSGLISYASLSLPPNLTIDSMTGVISGTLVSSNTTVYTFSVVASSGISNTSRLFSLIANSSDQFAINWLTLPGTNIGSIREGDKSLLAVRANSNSSWVRYEIVSGSLPNGLFLDVNNGDIWGMAEEQVSSDTDFTVTIRAYNETNFVDGEFTITLLDNYDSGATRVYVTLYGNDKLNYIDLFTTSEILIPNIFQMGNPALGLIRTPKIVLVENLDNPSAEDIQSKISDLRRTYLNLGRVLVGKAVVDDEIVYEVLYRKIYDDGKDNAPLDYIDPQTGEEFDYGSLRNIRTRLLELGVSGEEENLPLWMQSEQIIGDSASIPGWVPCIEFAYVKPGLGQGIADRINSNDESLNKLFMNRIRIDRVIMEPAADSSFTPRYLLFDNIF